MSPAAKIPGSPDRQGRTGQHAVGEPQPTALQPPCRRFDADADNDGIGVDRRAVTELDTIRAESRHVDAATDRHAIVEVDGGEQRSDVGSGAAEQRGGGGLHDADLAAGPARRRRHFQTDEPCTDDDKSSTVAADRVAKGEGVIERA